MISTKIFKNPAVYSNTPSKLEMTITNVKDERLLKLKTLILYNISNRREGEKPIDESILLEIQNLLQQLVNQTQLQGTKTPEEIINFFLEGICLQRGSAVFIVERCSFALLRYCILCKNEDKDLLKKLVYGIDALKYLLHSVNINLQLNALRSLEILSEDEDCLEKISEKDDKQFFRLLNKLITQENEEIVPRVTSLLEKVVKHKPKKGKLIFFFFLNCN